MDKINVMKYRKNAHDWVNQYATVLNCFLSLHEMETSPHFQDKEILLQMEELKLRLALKTLERLEING